MQIRNVFYGCLLALAVIAPTWSRAAELHKLLIRVDNARHFLMLGQPAAFDAALDAFLKN